MQHWEHMHVCFELLAVHLTTFSCGSFLAAMNCAIYFNSVLKNMNLLKISALFVI